MSTLARNSLFSAISLGLKFLSNALLFVILARSLGVADFGSFAFATSLTGIFLVIVDYGFNLQIVHDVAKSPGGVRGILQDICNAKLLLSILSTLAISLTVILSSHSQSSKLVILILWIGALCFSYGQLINSAYKGLNRFEREAYPTVILNLVQFTVILALLAFGQKMIPVAIGYTGARIVYFVVSYRYFASESGRIGFRCNFKNGWRTIIDSLPFGVHSILATIYFQVDTVMISYIKGDSEVGYYQAAMRIVIAAMLLYDIIISPFFPLIAKAFASDQVEFRGHAFSLNKYMFLVGSTISTFLYFFAEQVIGLLYGSSYAPSIHLLQLLAVVIFLRFAGAGYGLIITIADNQRMRAVGVTFSTVVNVGLNFYVIPRYGAVGAALSSIITHVVLVVFYAFFSYKTTHSFFVNAFCLRGLLVTGLAVIFCYYLKPYTILGAIAVFVFLPVMIASVALEKRENKKAFQILAKILLPFNRIRI